MIELEAAARLLSTWHTSALEMFITFTEADVANKQVMLAAAWAVLQGKANEGVTSDTRP